MSAVGSVTSGGGGPLTFKGATVAPAAAAGMRAPSTRIDFRSLLREDPVLREAAATPRAAPAPALGKPPPAPLPPSASPRSPPSASGLDAASDGHTPVASARDDDPLDPFARHHASLTSQEVIFSPAPPGVSIAPAPLVASVVATEVPATRALASLEDLMPALVRRVAYSGDGRRGTMRLELGAGKLAGSTLLVHAEGGRVRVHLEVAPGVDASGWQHRIQQRLGSRGIATDVVEVT